MVFPSLGVEIVRRIGASSRGTALGGFAAFQDVAYGATGPIAGLLAERFGLPSVFALGSIAAIAGLLATLALRGTQLKAAARRTGGKG
jgi:MFS family permease